MNLVDSIDSELELYEGFLRSIPFTNQPVSDRFLRVYKLNYLELYKYTQQTPFPMDSNKLLKLCISLGNLLKSLQQEEQMYQQQQQKPSAFNQIIGVNNTYRQTSLQNPFESPKHFISTMTPASQPLYQVKFIKNLLVILKNFDIGFVAKDSQSSTTLNQHLSSPIRLNSKQLLIEKLEINISLDTLFIFKNLLKILIRILSTLKDHLIVNGELGLLNGNTELSSIFSVNSSGSSESNISIDEYVKILNQILNRLSNGLVEPLLRYLLNFVNRNVTGEFKTLITSL